MSQWSQITRETLGPNTAYAVFNIYTELNTITFAWLENSPLDAISYMHTLTQCGTHQSHRHHSSSQTLQISLFCHIWQPVLECHICQ